MNYLQLENIFSSFCGSNKMIKNNKNNLYKKKHK